MATGTKLIAQNRRARFNYELERTLEAGVSLTGGEVKSAKAGEVSIQEAFVTMRGDEAWLTNAYIKPYQPNQGIDRDASRARKLLLHREELSKLVGERKAKGRTIVPTKMYLKRGKVKIEIAVGRGKKVHDKRASLKKREQEREAAQATKRRA